jgi:23S rRNA (adenine2503-C2)-methyltransferase
MPINRKYPLRELIAAMRKIPLRSGRKVTAEYVLLAGINDSQRDARDLARLLWGTRVKVNLIAFNAHEDCEFAPPSAETADRFREVLLASGIPAIRRERRGSDIRAACGQLRGAAG